MTGFVDLNTAYDIGTLTDWYISSVTDDPPVWTDEHIEELFNDFYVIPKDTPVADVAPVKHGEWKGNTYSKFYGLDSVSNPIYRDGVLYYCSECSRKSIIRTNYCPNCGAKMDG